MITIYYNPKCTKCRIAREALDKAGEELEIKEYLVHPPSKKELKDLLQKLQLSAEAVIRKNEEEWQQFQGKRWSEEELLDILVKYPKLLQRPIIVKGDKAVIGRDEESLRKIVVG